MTPALRRASDEPFTVSFILEEQNHKTVSRNHSLQEKRESRVENSNPSRPLTSLNCALTAGPNLAFDSCDEDSKRETLRLELKERE